MTITVEATARVNRTMAMMALRIRDNRVKATTRATLHKPRAMGSSLMTSMVGRIALTHLRDM
jgi:hypothetical protein